MQDSPAPAAAPGFSPYSSQVPLGVQTCAVHPDTEATACSRCGTFACDRCLVGDSRNKPLCAACDARLASAAAANLTANARAVAASGLAFILAAGIVAIQTLVGTGFHAWLFIVLLLAFLAVAVTFALWFRRTNIALRERGAKLEFGPNGWAWMLVPVMNLFKPYYAVLELHDYATGHQYTRLLPLWWFSWILQIVVSRLLPNTSSAALATELVLPGVTAALLVAITHKITQSMVAARPAGLKRRLADIG